MIRNNTLFVVGAGASHCYDLPSGDKLREQAIAYGVASEHEKREQIAATATNFDVPRVNSFLRDLAKASAYSIDEFVESRPDYLEIGRAVIVRLLAPEIHRAEEHLRGIGLGGSDGKRPDDWTRYLLSEMSHDTKSVEDFLKNPVRFIVFNFDMLLEHRIAEHFSARYGLPLHEAHNLVAATPIVHPHGALYGISVGDCTPQRMKKAAAGIRLIHDEAHPDAKIETFLNEAKVVCFLGFSYHPLNLGRLSGNRKDALANRHVYGTAFGLGEGQLARVARRLSKIGAPISHPKPKLGPRQLMCEEFLKENDVLR